MSARRPAPPDAVVHLRTAGWWEVHRVEASGCSHGVGPTEEAAMVAWRRDVAERMARGEEVSPAPSAHAGAPS